VKTIIDKIEELELLIEEEKPGFHLKIVEGLASLKWELRSLGKVIHDNADTVNESVQSLNQVYRWFAGKESEEGGE